MNLLFLAHRVPYPPNRGDRIRSYHLIEWLARRANVSLAYLTDEPPPRETTEVLESLCGPVTYDCLGRGRWLRAIRSFASGHTATEGLFFSPALKRSISNWARDIDFDAVFVFCSSMVQYLDVPGLANVPAVVDLVDVDSQKWLDYAEHAWGPKRWLLRLEGERLRRLEASLPERVDAVAVVTDREADVFASFSPHRPHVLRNGVDLEYFSPNGEEPRENELNCVFVGALDYDANVDGLSWFCREVWPHVRSEYPQAVFRIVGSRPNAESRRLGRLPGVELVGQVPDVRPYLHAATVVTVPLRVARGVQNKVLEALAAGKPVIVSPQALDGIDARAGRDLIRATDPSEWTRAISDLFRAPDRRTQLAHHARAFVERTYCWDTQLAQLGTGPAPVVPGLEC